MASAGKLAGKSAFQRVSDNALTRDEVVNHLIPAFVQPAFG